MNSQLRLPQRPPHSQLSKQPQKLPDSQLNRQPQKLLDSQLNKQPQNRPKLKKQRLLVTKTTNKMAATLPNKIIMQPPLRLQPSPWTQCPTSSATTSSEVRVNLIL